MPPTIIIAQPPDAAEQADELARLACEAGQRTLLIPDLHDLPEDSPVWEPLQDLPGEAVVFSSLHPRPAEWILRRHGVDRAEVTCYRLDAETDVQEVWREATLQADTAPGTVEDLRVPVEPRWYPVVDLNRCENCHHCVQFCLFGAWGEDESGQAWVKDPDACKDGCPACARICPHGAIMFPRHEEDAAIAGAPGAELTPDPEARRMYYVRTEKPCPVCGLVGKRGLRASDGAVCCPECGRYPSVADFPGGATPAVVRDEIDALIGELDEALGGEGS